MATEIGPLIGSGRDCDIFEYGVGQVVRRSRDGRSLEQEARVLEYVADHGYPVPRVANIRAGGTEIVMERIDGPMMLDVLVKRPASIRKYAILLADLHDRLHSIPGPLWLPQASASEGPDAGVLLHLDLHPLNVMMTGRGPVVIDWTNAGRGNPLTDVGVTYALLTCPQVPAPLPVRMLLGRFRSLFANIFARRYRGPEFDVQTAFAAELKMCDPNMAPAEIEQFRKLAVRLRQ